MNTIELVEKFEDVGFTRKQAEMQVITIDSIKNGLMTREDGKRLQYEMEMRFKVVDDRFWAVNDRLDGMQSELRSMQAEIRGIQSELQGVQVELRSLPHLLLVKIIVFQSTIMGAMLVFLELARFYWKW